MTKFMETANDSIYNDIMKLTKKIFDGNMMPANYVGYEHFKKNIEVFCETIGCKQVQAYLNNMRLRIVE